jgi:hypothetical protein
MAIPLCRITGGAEVYAIEVVLESVSARLRELVAGLARPEPFLEVPLTVAP